MLGRLLVAVVALVLGVQVVRNSAVAALSDRSPDIAVRIWAGHPTAEASLGMAEIGRAARRGKPAPANVLATMNDVALKAPLASEQFLVRGVQAQLAGQQAIAVQAFAAAERRDPRALPAHFFLAETLFRSGNPARGLKEVAVLARLSPLGLGNLSPYLAAYAQDRSTWPQLRELFRANPDLEETTLETLASDPRNADTVIALSNAQNRNPKLGWVPGLLYGLVGAGDYVRAHELWAAISHVRPGTSALYDPGFSETKAPAPFNWDLTSSTVGLAERQPGGGLHAIFYGREDGVLAKQLLLLAPGNYRMSIAVGGNPSQARALTWSIRCDRTQAPFAAIPLDVASAKGWNFTVPANCPAQWLELTGVSSDLAQQSEVTVGKLSLVRERSNG